MTLSGLKLPPTAVFGLAVLAAFIATALFGPWLVLYDPDTTVGRIWLPPSTAFWLGTDNIGREILSREIAGARTTIGLALITTILSFTIGVSAGIFAAVSGPKLGNLLARMVDMVLSVPVLIMALIVLTALGSSIPTLILTIALLDSTRVFLVARAVAGDVAARDFVDVARLRGEGMRWIMVQEILPNALPRSCNLPKFARSDEEGDAGRMAVQEYQPDHRTGHAACAGCPAGHHPCFRLLDLFQPVQPDTVHCRPPLGAPFRSGEGRGLAGG